MALTAARYAILSATTECYRCSQRTPVVALALPPEAQADDEAPYEHGWLNAIDVAELPPKIALRLRECPGGANYKVDFSVTAGERYVLNHCTKCGAKLGDHFMHSEPDGPFFGESTDALHVREVREHIVLDCGYAEGPLGLWVEDQLQGLADTK